MLILDATMINTLTTGIIETIYMVFVSMIVTYVFGLPLGVILFVTDKGSLYPNRIVNLILGFLVNVFRSIPFLILLVLLLPFTRFVVGTTLGSTATIVPLVVSAIPFVARMVESSLKEVDAGVIEAALSMGSNWWQLITKVLLPEAKPSLAVGAVITSVTVLGYSAMAGFVGGGGRGTIAINYGYYRYDNNVMIITVAVIVIIVQLIQVLGMKLATKIDKR